MQFLMLLSGCKSLAVKCAMRMHVKTQLSGQIWREGVNTTLESYAIRVAYGNFSRYIGRTHLHYFTGTVEEEAVFSIIYAA